MNYYILSLKHSPLAGMAVWWGPNDCGYYTDLDSAGIYTQGQVDAAPKYYNNGETTAAIARETVVKASKLSVQYSTIKPKLSQPV